MRNNNLLSLLKTMAIRFEDHSWTNTRGTNSQSALIFKPEDKEKIFYIIVEKINNNETDCDLNKNFDTWIEEDSSKSRYFFYGLETFQRVSLSRKKSYKSYIADLDAPVRERINYLKSELRKAREGKVLGRPPLMIEELIKQAEQKTLREQILESFNKVSEKNISFQIKLKDSKKCLITNFLSVSESLWMNTKASTGKAIQKRLGIGITILFSAEHYLNKSYEVAQKIETASKNGWVLGDYILF